MRRDIEAVCEVGLVFQGAGVLSCSATRLSDELCRGSCRVAVCAVCVRRRAGDPDPFVGTNNLKHLLVFSLTAARLPV